jgi:hypothetical protein
VDDDEEDESEEDEEEEEDEDEEDEEEEEEEEEDEEEEKSISMLDIGGIWKEREAERDGMRSRKRMLGEFEIQHKETGKQRTRTEHEQKRHNWLPKARKNDKKPTSCPFRCTAISASSWQSRSRI